MCLAVEYAQQTVLARRGHKLSHLSANHYVVQRARLRDVPIVRVVRNELSIPRDATRARVECDDAIRVQIVTLANAAGKVRCGVGGGGKHQSRLRVQGHRGPHRATAHHRALGNTPRFRARLSLERNRAKAPHRVTVRETETANPPADGVLRTRRPNDHQVVVNHRRHRQGFTDLRVRHLFRPHFLARAEIERHQIAIGGAAHRQSILHRDAAILWPVGGAARFPHVTPLRAACACIERNGHARRGHNHHAVHDNGVRLERTDIAYLERASRREASRIRGRDLLDGGVAGAGVIVQRIQPVCRVLRGPEKLRVRRRGATWRALRERHCRRGEHSHHQRDRRTRSDPVKCMMHELPRQAGNKSGSNRGCWRSKSYRSHYG